jgi:hypothetical protein
VKARIIGLAGVLSLVALGCASGGRWRSESTAAPGADVAAYATFGWLSDRDGRRDGNDAPLSIRDAKLREAIRAELVAKGYREVAASPELRIGFETDARVKEQTTPPVRVGVGVGSWGGHVGTHVDASVPVGDERVTNVAEVQLTIRAVDPEGNRELWVGRARGEMREELDESALERAVAAALDGLPARH